MYQFLDRTGGAMQISKLKMRNRWSIIPVCKAVTWSQIFLRQRTSVAFLLFCQLWQEQIIDKYFVTFISILKIIALITTSFHKKEFISVTNWVPPDFGRSVHPISTKGGGGAGYGPHLPPSPQIVCLGAISGHD